MNTMKNTTSHLPLFSILLILLLCLQFLVGRNGDAHVHEARVSTGVSILMVLGFIYGSWRLMGMGRKE